MLNCVAETAVRPFDESVESVWVSCLLSLIRRSTGLVLSPILCSAEMWQSRLSNVNFSISHQCGESLLILMFVYKVITVGLAVEQNLDPRFVIELLPGRGVFFDRSQSPFLHLSSLTVNPVCLLQGSSKVRWWSRPSNMAQTRNVPWVQLLPDLT